MTIAWKLFYFGTSRGIRSSTPRQQQQEEEEGEEENHDAVLNFRRRDRDRHRDAAVRRPSHSRPQQGKVSPSPLPRHPFRRAAAAQPEREPVVLEKKRTSEHGARSSSKSGLANRCVGRTFNDRLPGSVVEARARLAERLRSCHLSESRPNRAATEVSLDKHDSDELVIGDPGDQNRGTASELQEETFLTGEIDGDRKAECPICLERFSEGEGLVRLHCGHRFHHACLEPWLQAQGVCPYCRASI